MKARLISLVLICLATGVISGCAHPLAEGRVTSTDPISRIVPSDPNKIYYAIKWAMNECGYPLGSENLTEGILESKWVPVNPTSHYLALFRGRDYGTTGSYYKMVVRIVPIESGKSRVEASTEVNSVIQNVKSTGEKERTMLERIAEHSRDYNIVVTNLGVEE